MHPTSRSGARASSRLWRGAVACVAGLVAATAGAGEDDFGQLMQRFAGRPHGHAAFVETQFLSVLKHPLESSGELFFDAPDRLEKRTLRPKPETLIVEKGMLMIERGTHRYAVALKAYPQLGPLIDSIRATLAGDRAALESTYAIDFSASERGWVLGLTPRDAKLAAVIKRVSINGAGDEIRTVETLRADGDRSVMSITVLADS